LASVKNAKSGREFGGVVIMESIKRFVECLIPVTACNLKCSYCYVIQRDNKKNKMAEWKYTPEQIGEAMKKDRWGGTCYFSICGAGETTLQVGLEGVVFQILKQGHFVNITTNGTVRKRLDAIVEKAIPYIDHLHFAFSIHYLELKNKNLLDMFFENVNYVKDAGASILVQLNLCDEYIPYLNEIKCLCIDRIGTMPQVVATRKEEKGLQKIELLTEYTQDEYEKIGQSYDSPLFDFTMKNFNVKRKEFCYAGDWSATLNLSTGITRRCYGSYIYQDIFKNPNERIRFLAIGNYCGSPFCMNSSHFMSFGIIPSIECPSYAELRDRENARWYNNTMKEFASSKLHESNSEYGFMKKAESNIIGMCDTVIRHIYQRFIKGK